MRDRRVSSNAVLALVAAALVAGCGGGPSATETLMSAVRSYNDGVRWQRLPVAAASIPPAEREAFLDEREELADDLRINDYEVMRLELDDAGVRAKVRVEYTWYLDSVGQVHKTVSSQSWERHGKAWLLAEERRVRGEPMPGLAEPLEDDEDDEDEQDEHDGHGEQEGESLQSSLPAAP
jgi:hypothetical protein